MGCGAAIAAVALGAVVVEKHFTLARADGGVDSTFSLEPAELAMLRTETERAWQAMGGVVFGGTAAEKKSQAFRRSLYVVKDMQPGEAFTADNVRAIRPGMGMAPKYMETVLGMRAVKTIARGTPLDWALLKG
jgi:sialic acid synthase SpsE